MMGIVWGEAVMTLAAREDAGHLVEVIRRVISAMPRAWRRRLKTGIAALSSETDGAFVFLGDMPRIPLSLAPQLAEGIGNRGAAAPSFKGERGHPVLFAARLFPDLLRLRGDQGARGILDAMGDDLALVAVEDAGVLFDVDRRSDLAP